jgi:hypothetical protein
MRQSIEMRVAKTRLGATAEAGRETGKRPVATESTAAIGIWDMGWVPDVPL